MATVVHQSRVEERHARAVAQTVLWAKAAADGGDYQEALSWLRVLETVEGKLDPALTSLRDSWRAITERNAVSYSDRRRAVAG
jgi:hypothetical protein